MLTQAKKIHLGISKVLKSMEFIAPGVIARLGLRNQKLNTLCAISYSDFLGCSDSGDTVTQLDQLLEM